MVQEFMKPKMIKHLHVYIYWMALVRASIHELTVFWSENSKTDSCLQVICNMQSQKCCKKCKTNSKKL